MRIETQRKILALSQRIISEWYKGRTDELIPLLDDKAMWIGAAASQFYCGRTDVAAALKRVSDDIPPCIVSEEMWFLEECGSDWGLCTGKWICTVTSKNHYLQQPQRATFLWRTDGKALKVVHIHVSNPIYTTEPDKEFLEAASVRNYNYVQKKLDDKRRVVQIMTTDYQYSLVDLDFIIYIEAQKECLLIHTSENDYRMHEGIGSFVKNNCPDFIFAHRSYAANPDWIKTVTPTEVILINGEKLSISRQRYKTICEKIKERFC